MSGRSSIRGYNFPNEQSDVVFPTTPGYFSKMARLRLQSTERKSGAIIRNIASAVGTLQHWLLTTYREPRVIEVIPPAELDAYLEAFFAVITKPNQQNYEPESFKNVRSNIERFLQEKGYQGSITKSPSFRRSQLAFRRRKSTLKPIHCETQRAAKQLETEGQNIY